MPANKVLKKVEQTALQTFTIGETYSWAEVRAVHRVRNGVYQKNEVLISLLTDFGEYNRCYPDRANENNDVIQYTGNGRRGDQPLNPANRSLLAAVTSGHSVPLFQKLRVGHWQYLGLWRVTGSKYVYDQETERMIWQFTLQREK